MRRVAVLAISAAVAACTANTSNQRRADSESLGLAPQDISKIVMANYPAFRSCYESSASAGKSGTVTIAFTVAPEGFVSRAGERLDPPAAPSHVARPWPARLYLMKDAGLTKCLMGVFAKMTFREVEKPTGVNWTFDFRPGGD
jgi:hypothetical protein